MAERTALFRPGAGGPGRLRLPEWVKTVLIVLLSLSALWLLAQSPLYRGSPLESRVARLFAPGETGGQETVSLTAAARPVRAAVVNDDGRYGVQYDEDAVGGVFDSLGALLGEALAAAQTPSVITESRWQEALQAPGVYFDFTGSIPFSALTQWLRGGEAGGALTGSVRRIALAAGPGAGDVWLYWQDAGTEEFYACATALDRELHLTPSLAAYLPNAAFFAFEDEAYAACDPYTLITAAPSPAVYAAFTPLSAENDGAVTQVLEALSYSTSSGSTYAISDGTRYTDGSGTFHLTDNGVLSYYAGDASRYPIPAEGETPTVSECIETTRRLVEDTAGRLCGDARLNLISAQWEGSDLVLTYGYSLNGAAVYLYDEGWAARFTVSGGFIDQFALRFRSYTATTAITMLLPELQAAAALPDLGAEHAELLLCYLDTGGDSVSAGWIAN